MKDYSQHGEQPIILNFFANQATGNLLSIGENDGETLSNAYALIQKGWGGCLFEPVPKVFEKLKQLHAKRDNVHCYPYAMATINGKFPFYESGEHLTPNDHGLISTMVPTEISRWKGSKFDNFIPTEVECINFETFYKDSPIKEFDFITIDAEGMDYSILSQINLSTVKAKLVCVEYNGDRRTRQQFNEYFSRFKFRMYWNNGTNLMYAAV